MTAGCTAADTETDGRDPLPACVGSPAHDVVDALWRDLDTHYALFDLRLAGGDWDALASAACERLTGTTTDEELFAILVELVEPFDDGHIQLEAPELGLSDDAWVSEYPHYAELAQIETNVEARYLDGDLTWAAQDWFAWGTIGSIGYVSITSMDGLSASEDEADDIDAATAAMDLVLADLAGTTAMIVDVRANEGGWDTVALAIATRFTGPATLAWSEQRRDGPAHDDCTPWVDTMIAAGDEYGAPVIVLTSGGTFSAAETFALAMRVRDDVRIFGEPSSGHFSDLEDGTLPNDWEYTYSAERYRAADGEIYETHGVPVDQAITFDVAALATGTDVMLDAALAAVGE
jgi:hypothetical protein